MRLLNSHTGDIREFWSEPEIPPYAILSHTWLKGSEEVKLAELVRLSTPERESKEGFRKIKFCFKQAIEDGLHWIWVDT
jgi:hypothetical protein